MENRTPVLLVQHEGEARKSTSTGRIAALALERCTLVVTSGRDLSEAQIAPGAVLLFPGSELRASFPAIEQLVVIDGTWKQASRLARRAPALAKLPRFSLPTPIDAAPRLRAGHEPHCMATLEALGRALLLLEGEACAAPLLALQRRYVEEVLASRGVRAAKAPQYILRK